MIICLCTGITESELQRCIQKGALSLESIEASCGAGSCCQSCHPEILSILAEEYTCAMSSDTGDPNEKKFPNCGPIK